MLHPSLITFVTGSEYVSLYDPRLLPPIIRSKTKKNRGSRSIRVLSKDVGEGFLTKMSKLSKEQGRSASAASAWLYSPWLDLVVGCGAWSVPLLLLSYFSIASSTRAWSIAFYALALFFNYPHYMATIYRAYHRADDFQKYRIFTVYTTALVLLTGLLSHFWLGILPWIFTIYLTWSPWHYSGQNYGLFMMFAAPCRSAPWQGRTPRSLRRFYNVLSYSFSGIPHWSFIGPFVRFAGNSSGCESLGAGWNGRGFPHALSLRFVTSGAGCRVAKTAAMPDTILLPVSVVLAARGYVADQRDGDPTKPL